MVRVCCWYSVNTVNTSFLAFSLFTLIGIVFGLALPICVVLICVLVIYPRLRDSIRRKRSCDGLYVRKLIYFWSLLVAMLVSCAFNYLTFIEHEWLNGGAITPLNIIRVMIPIYHIVVISVLCYKMWSVLPASAARTTPGKAVGFQFIPLFNLYWFFQAWWGWVKDFNCYLEERQLASHHISEGISLAFCITILGQYIVSYGAWFVDAPPIGLLTSVIPQTLLLIFIFKTCTTLNALPQHIVQPKVETSGT